MNSSTLRKVNQFGKIGNIIIKVMLVLIIIITIVIAGAAVFLSNVPEDAAVVSVTGNAKISVDDKYFEMIWNHLSEEASYTSSDEPTSFLPLEDENMQVKFSLYNQDFTSAAIRSEDNQKTIEATTDTFTYQLGDFVAVLICSVVFLASVIVSLFMLRKLFKEFAKCESPFSENIVKKMHFFSISLIPLAVFSSVSETIAGSFLNPEQNVSVCVQWGVIIAFVVAFCMGTVFKYGAQLQRESDETL